MEINEELINIKNVIEEELYKLLSDKAGYQELIFESINYSLLDGGKRIRPILLLKSSELFKGNYDNSLPFALAVEMIHTYSLIHDDLPSMDNDDFRRGKPTTHKVYGEAIAILSGDGLLNLAFETMLDYSLRNSKTLDDYQRNMWAAYEIARYSGIFGMIGGQVVDLLSNEINMDINKLIYMYESKTSALIQASVVAGTILGGGDKEDIQRMRKFGLYLGLAYQIRDDILDEEKDKLVNKVTFLSFHDKSKAISVIDELSQKAFDILSYYEDRDVNFLKELVKLLTYRNY
ncbi:polyprenyl synthetase family protein [Tepidimicrobium xylanilyticum]|uniref:Farnesyl diphosphate synthase n=1 Tax=Tepidimicrobium xylanilyticum TaxID=1123352 RepID=A0A1H3CSF9_9FIRM|nr:polyprenyl synthetase family protein [Tepidimicrobium xylanilyticum]GMG97723.1 geranyltranstransferase [Tepidimicrobium xylanilyticum]SDX56980.1 geranylgeranyl diphosphate synthase, type II [Tepidimicrobium xylanilyticum]